MAAARNGFPTPPDDETVTARTVRAAAVVHVPDVFADPLYQNEAVARVMRYRASLGAPMIRDGHVIGAIFVARTRPGPFADSHIALLQTFADQAVIAIENVRLFTELEARNLELRVTLEQQTATSEILRVISRSQTDVQPVFDAIARNALHLCDATWSTVWRCYGEIVHPRRGRRARRCRLSTAEPLARLVSETGGAGRHRAARASWTAR